MSNKKHTADLKSMCCCRMLIPRAYQMARRFCMHCFAPVYFQ